MDMAMNDTMPIHNSSVPATLSPFERPVRSLSARSAFAAHKDDIDRLDLAWAHYDKGHLSADDEQGEEQGMHGDCFICSCRLGHRLF